MNVVLCCIALKEERYLDEWIVYYLFGLNFDGIHIYDNSPENVLRYVPNKYPPGKVNVIHLPGPTKQREAYNLMLQKFKTRPDTWIAFYDCDEFLVLKKHATIQDFVRQYAAMGDGIVANWYLFGDSGLSGFSPRPVTERFVHRGGAVNQHVKTICRAVAVKTMSCHHAEYMPGKRAVDTLGRHVDGPFNPEGPVDTAVIHHYFTKTREEFTEKRNRGKAWAGGLRNPAEFDAHNENEVYDNSAMLIYKQSKERKLCA